MAQTTATAALYAYISGSWVQLNDVQPWSASWGMSDNGPLDLVADIGEMKFRLDNSTGLYTPGGPSALAGFKRGVPVKRVVTFEGEEYVRFRGYISEIELRPSNRDKTIGVTCLDWMDFASRHPVVNEGILFQTNSATVMQVLHDRMETPPQQTSFTTGIYAFQSAFDAATTQTTAYNEIVKIALNEIAHVYLKKDRTDGETLTLESLNTRHGWVTPDEVPLAAADSDTGIWEDSDAMLWEDGDTVLWNETAAVTFGSSTIENFEAPYGDMVINRVVVHAYPRREDASPQILFQLDEPLEINKPQDDNAKVGVLFTIEGNFANPDGGRPIGGRDIVTPVITTDYLMNTAEDGSGTNVSSYLSIDSFEYGADGFTAILSSSYPSPAYITQFNVRGTGIYEYNPLIRTVKNDPSIEEFGAQTIDFHMKYRKNHRLSFPFAFGVVLQYGQPRTILESVYFCANKSPTLMMAYLHTDVGSLRTIDIDELGIHGNYYVQGVEDKYDEGLIWVKWILKEHPSILGGDLTDIAIDLTSASGDAINYGPLVRVSGATERTFAAWINADLLDGTRSIIAPIADAGGVIMYVSDSFTGSGQLCFDSNRYISVNGIWHSTTTAITAGSWFHVAVCYDHTSATNDPIMYVNGILQTIVEDSTPAGALNVEIGTHVVVGNSKTITLDYVEGFDGKIYDARIYDRIITAAEALTLYNSGTPDPSLVTDGLVFGGLAEMPADYAAHLDTALDSSDYLFENAYRSTGRVHGTPIVRAAP